MCIKDVSNIKTLRSEKSIDYKVISRWYQVSVIDLWIDKVWNFEDLNDIAVLIELTIQFTNLVYVSWNCNVEKQWNASLTNISFDIRVEISSSILVRGIEE